MSDTLRERLIDSIEQSLVDVGAYIADGVLSVLHEAEEQGDGMCPDPECATDHICGDGGCRMNTLLADMGHERWVDAWREAADWRDQYRADREDGVELLKDILAWNFEAIPPGFASRIEGYISRVERQSSPAVAGEQDGCAHEWVYDSEGDYGECKLCDASINVVAGFSRTIHQPLPVRPPTGEQESDQ